MSKNTCDLPDSHDKSLYRIGAFSAFIIGIGYIFITILYVFVGGKTPIGGESTLKFLTGKTNAWEIIIWLSIITDMLYLPVVYCLNNLLKRFNEALMLLASSLLTIFVFLELSITWPNFSSLITLTNRYNVAINESQRIMYISSAEYSSSMLKSPILAFYTIFIPSLAVLILSIFMLKGVFGRATAYIGILSGVMGMISMIGGLYVELLGLLIIPGSIFTMIWFLLIGDTLVRRIK